MFILIKIAYTSMDIKGIRELLIEGKSLLSLFKELLNHLDIYKDWANTEILERFVSATIRHSYLKETKDKVIEIKEKICKFKSKLKVIYLYEDANSYTYDFLTTAEKFSKEFFIDWLNEYLG